MISRQLTLISFVFVIIGCKSSPEKSEEITIEVTDPRATKANERVNFYTILKEIKLRTPYKVNGNVITAIRKLYGREELAPLGIRRIQFRYLNISKSDLEDFEMNPEAPSIDMKLKAGVPADVVMQQIETQTRWHISHFADGIVTINCWSIPQYEDDYYNREE